MKDKYGLSKMKSRRNPYVKVLLSELKSNKSEVFCADGEAGSRCVDGSLFASEGSGVATKNQTGNCNDGERSKVSKPRGFRRA